MKKYRKLSLQDEIDKEAKRIEKRILENPDLKDIQVSEEFDAAFLKKIQEYEKKKSRKRKKEDTSYRRYRIYRRTCARYGQVTF